MGTKNRLSLKPQMPLPLNATQASTARARHVALHGWTAGLAYSASSTTQSAYLNFNATQARYAHATNVALYGWTAGVAQHVSSTRSPRMRAQIQRRKQQRRQQVRQRRP